MTFSVYNFKRGVHFLAFLFTFLVGASTLKAQQLRVEIRVVEVSSSGYAGEGRQGSRFRFYKEMKDDPHNLVNGACISIDAINNAWRIDRGLNYVYVDASNPVFNLLFVTHNERKEDSGNCSPEDVSGVTFRKPDLYEAQSVFSVNLANYSPGVFSAEQTVVNRIEGTTASCKIKIRYTINTPTQPTVQAAASTSGPICADDQVTLTTTVNMPNLTGLRYVWEYYLPGDDSSYLNPNFEYCLGYCEGLQGEPYYDCMDNCYTQYQDNRYVSEPRWRPLNVPSIATVAFSPTEVIPFEINTNMAIWFRVRAQSADLKSANSSVKIIDFSPPAPSATVSSPTASCLNKNTGTILLSNIKGIAGGQYLYMLKRAKTPGEDAVPPCDPEDNAGQPCTQDVVMSARFYPQLDGTYPIPNVPPGNFIIWLANPGSTYGLCKNSYAVRVETLPVLSRESVVPSPATCYGKADGSLTVRLTAGAGTKQFVLTKAPDFRKDIATTGLEAVFTDLAAGAYSLTVSDECQELDSEVVTVLQPAKIAITNAAPTDATCSNPGNGQLLVDIAATSGLYDEQTADRHYTYRLAKGSDIIRETKDTAATSWHLQGLPVGTYQLQVKEATGDWCSGEAQEIKIQAPAELSITQVQSTNIDCYGNATGIITLTATGGTGEYHYVLKRGDTGLEEQNTTGVFSNLSAGSYTATLKSRVAGCQDRYIHPSAIVLTQPTALSISLLHTNISCFGNNDGRVTAKVSGGTGNYVYTWQYKTASTWSTLSSTNADLTGLQPGTYRLLISDERTCQANSQEVAIDEPQALHIASVKVVDIQCYNEKGRLEPIITGGTPPYALAYSTDAGKTYSPFTATTLLTAGTYGIKVSDANTCSATYATPLTITAPPRALSFSYTLSDYNGYSVSCFGSSNGHLILRAVGGNGNTYAGYTYAIDNRAYQGDSVLTDITAGEHTVLVRDSRGCVASQKVVFTQPNAVLSMQLVRKTDVVCYGDSTGTLEVQAIGGTAPYQFTLNPAQSYQNSGQFAGLKAETYTVTVQDKNGCSNIISVTLTHLNPAIQLAATISPVSCFGAQDGRIRVAVEGGVGPYQYQWSEVGKTDRDLLNVKTGTYSLRITDQRGCSKDTVFTVGQPLVPLSVYVHSKPVCYGSTTGLIRLLMQGGTAPYQYSINNGQTYQPIDSFLVGVGTYPILIKDKNDCSVTSTTTIVQRNEKPEPNFLVASQRNAFDTLVIKETSVPKPDSIHWHFDAQTLVLDRDAWSPKIKFDQAGSYSLTMIGYWNGCDYALTKILHLDAFDPHALLPVLPTTDITLLEISPNPNDGNFKVKVAMARRQSLVMVITDVLGNEHYRKKWDKTEGIEVSLQLPQVASGFYILRVITDTDAKEGRVLVNKL